jgi:predicted DNA-binding transcriptional regulator AlpA
MNVTRLLCSARRPGALITELPKRDRMSASPVHQLSAVGHADDVFERLARSDRLLTAKELADILAISPKTLYNYVSRGMIPYFKIESNVRFSSPCLNPPICDLQSNQIVVFAWTKNWTI